MLEMKKPGSREAQAKGVPLTAHHLTVACWSSLQVCNAPRKSVPLLSRDKHNPNSRSNQFWVCFGFKCFSSDLVAVFYHSPLLFSLWYEHQWNFPLAKLKQMIMQGTAMKISLSIKTSHSCWCKMIFKGWSFSFLSSPPPPPSLAVPETVMDVRFLIILVVSHWSLRMIGWQMVSISLSARIFTVQYFQKMCGEYSRLCPDCIMSVTVLWPKLVWLSSAFNQFTCSKITQSQTHSR